MREQESRQWVASESEQAGAGEPEAPTGMRPVEPCREDGVMIDFDAIAHGSKLVLIRFRGQVYQLRATRNGKLILNK